MHQLTWLIVANFTGALRAHTDSRTFERYLLSPRQSATSQLSRNETGAHTGKRTSYYEARILSKWRYEARLRGSQLPLVNESFTSLVRCPVHASMPPQPTCAASPGNRRYRT